MYTTTDCLLTCPKRKSGTWLVQWCVWFIAGMSVTLTDCTAVYNMVKFTYLQRKKANEIFVVNLTSNANKYETMDFPRTLITEKEASKLTWNLSSWDLIRDIHDWYSIPEQPCCFVHSWRCQHMPGMKPMSPYQVVFNIRAAQRTRYYFRQVKYVVLQYAMAHLGGTPPLDQLSSGSTLITNPSVVDSLQLPSQPPNRRGSREMIAGRVPVIVEPLNTSEVGDVILEVEFSCWFEVGDVYILVRDCQEWLLLK